MSSPPLTHVQGTAARATTATSCPAPWTPGISLQNQEVAMKPKWRIRLADFFSNMSPKPKQRLITPSIHPCAPFDLESRNRSHLRAIASPHHRSRIAPPAAASRGTCVTGSPARESHCLVLHQKWVSGSQRKSCVAFLGA
eukprot:1159145-Pelagomonas_calceolata.AAC.15